MFIIYIENKVISGIKSPVISADKNRTVFTALDFLSVDIV